MTDQVEVEIVFDPIFGGQAKRRIIKESGKTGNTSGKNFRRGFSKGSAGISRALGGIRSQALGIGVALAGAFAFKGLVNAVSEIEKLETGLTTLLRSSALARETLADLQTFAANTPFQLPGIARSATQLLAFGFAQDEIIDKLGTLGDVAAGSNSRLEEVALIFGQVSAAGKLTGERLLQLQERAIPIGSALASSLGVAESEVRGLVTAGKIGFAEFEQAFKSLSDEGGLFEGALERQSKTVGGVLSTLGDNFFNLQVALGKAFGPAIISTANQFIEIFKSFSDRVTANGPILVRTFSRLADIFLITPAKFWTDFFAGDANSNLRETNAEIANFERQLAGAEKRLEGLGPASEDGFFSKLLGGRNQALQDIGDFSAKLSELRTLRAELTGANKEDTTVLKENLKIQKEAALAEQQAAKKQIENQKLVQGLGGIGLTREQVIQDQASKDLAALQLARENEAITEEDFAARKMVREQQLSEQIGTLRDQENEKRMQQLQLQEQAALDNESTLGDSLRRVGSQFKSVGKTFKITSKDIANSLVRGIGGAAASGFAAFGKALVTGENALKAFGKAVLAALGQQLITMGSGFILQGVAQSIAGFGSGAPLIAAGAAMVTFGGAISALTGGGSSTAGGADVAGSGGGGGGVASGNDEDIIAQQEEREEPSTQVALTVNGDIIDTDDTRIRLVELLNQSFDLDGTVVTG